MTKPDNGFDIQITDVNRVHIERLSESTILLHVYGQDGSLRTLSIAANSPVLVSEKGNA